MKPPTEPIDFSEQERLKQRFTARAKALTLVRLSLLILTQTFIFHLSWGILVGLSTLIAFHLSSTPKWGRLIILSTLLLDVTWIGFAVSQTGVFESPLIAILPAITLLFALLFHHPFFLSPPLILLPIFAILQPQVSIQTLTLFSIINGCIIYLTNRVLSEEEFTNYKLLKLERRLKQQAVIEERHRLSREIHDGMGSSLSALILEAEQSGLPEIKNLARQALEETRYAISIMRNDLDLNLQIKNCIKLFTKRHHIKVKLKEVDDLSGIDNKQALSILRILQESLTNIGRHAKASEVEIEASIKQNQLVLDIKDNGIGFKLQDIPKNHYGIRNIEERVLEMGGTLQIQSQPDSGTHIQIGASV
ncbi:MAG: sensor histidine kinase [Deltaproteobacteria bacterium]|nr:sensor histidine kinase [Deltaproteobacteria bacterium]